MCVFVDSADDSIIENMQFCLTCVGSTALVVFPANCPIPRSFLLMQMLFSNTNFLLPLFDMMCFIAAVEAKKINELFTVFMWRQNIRGCINKYTSLILSP